MKLIEQPPWQPLRPEVIRAIQEADEWAWSLYPLPDRPPWKTGDPIENEPEWEAAFQEGCAAVRTILHAMFPNAQDWEFVAASGDATLAVAADRAAIEIRKKDVESETYDHLWLGSLDHCGREAFVGHYHANLVDDHWSAVEARHRLSTAGLIPA